MAVRGDEGDTARLLDSRNTTETTPLIQKEASAKRRACGKPSVVWRVLFTSFLASLSFATTQVPLVYVLGLMTCEEYYKTHLDTGLADRCKVPEIEASTARSLALLAAGTTLFGVANLFFTNWSIKRFGVKTALLISVSWPAIRLAIQNVGVQTGGGLGITITQCSQVITIFGGPAGYLLSLNSFATEVVEASNRTAILGQLQGIAFFGTSLGYLAGGLISDIFGKIAPFRVTLALFLISTLYIWLSLPRLANNVSPDQLKKTASLSAFVEPLRMFVPRRWILKDGSVRRQYGILLLGAGAFLSQLSTGFIPSLLQMYATDELDFGTTENGWLVSINSLIRGLFLTFAFPAIISSGRSWLDHRQAQRKEALDKLSRTESQIPDLPRDFEPGPIEGQSVEEPIQPPQPAEQQPTSFQFDLLYTRYSILADGALTALATFTSRPWHLYLVAIVIPLAAGTGSAAKGTILQMCEPEQRNDALSAISLIEMSARLASTGMFGYVFSAFAGIGRTNLTFLANGGVAVLSFLVLLVTYFPPPGAKRMKEDEDQESEEE